MTAPEEVELRFVIFESLAVVKCLATGEVQKHKLKEYK